MDPLNAQKLFSITTPISMLLISRDIQLFMWYVFIKFLNFVKAAERVDYKFARFLIINRARKNCRSGCIRCRLFVKALEKHERSERESE